MKILEAQNAVLSNVEVFDFLNDRRASLARERPARKLVPQTPVKEVMTYLSTDPAPLSQKPAPFTSADIPTLLEKLRGYSLTKGELLMIINLRPFTLPQLHPCVDEVDDRFTEQQQREILGIVAQVLGSFPLAEEALPPADGTGDGADADPVPSIENTAV